ncbi:hypothetical protein DXD04_03035 [Phocaeicola plebeius]|jgi:hypothetical protein|uniref:Uncharacterized protein n=2 Tax=Phocaeicola plebeius TaxID=310297 RepID=A0A3E4N7M9_9BACT|nr:hypothetical protein DXD04_03035 [Phocaeicola plebeius]
MIMENKIQMYVAQPSDKQLGMYEVAKYSETDSNYIPIKGEIYLTKKAAEERAHELNKEE